MVRKPEPRELVCSFCGNGPEHKLIASATVMICADCVAGSGDIARDSGNFVRPTAELTQVPSEGSFFSQLLFGARRGARHLPPTCEFCGKAASDLVQPPSVLGTRALICGECRQLCLEVISQRLDPNTPASQEHTDRP